MLIAWLAAFAVVALWLAWLSRRISCLQRDVVSLREQLSWRRAELLGLRGALSALADECRTQEPSANAPNDQLEQRLFALEAEQKRLLARQEQVELRDPDSRSYERAVQLVHRGASLDDLMTSCGLGRGEAELVLAMHRQQQPKHE